MVLTVAQVAAGGAVGAAGRYLVGVALTRTLGPGFPWGTLAVNLAGSFLMGVLVVAIAELGAHRLAPFFAIGLLGGFTTFSSFSLDAVTLYDRGQAVLAAGYVAGSVMAGIAALLAGLAVARWWFA